MSTEITSQSVQDLEAVIAAASEGRPVDPQVAQRIKERSDTIRAQLPATNIAVELIREARDQ